VAPAGILATALLRGAVTPLFFGYIYGWLPPLDDAVVVAYVAVFWFTSGCVADTQLRAHKSDSQKAHHFLSGQVVQVLQGPTDECRLRVRFHVCKRSIRNVPGLSRH
jgi:hypothetical protein